jgi:two-component system, OmpR family, response regulator RegX3
MTPDWRANSKLPVTAQLHRSSEMRIAVLEDDRSQAFLLRHCLTSAGHHPINFDKGADVLRAVGEEKFDALLLDWNVPDLSGIEVLNRVRNELNSNIPAVVVTSRDAEEDIVKALQEGADDYICKPIRPKELVARLEVVIKHDAKQPSDDVIEVGRLRVQVPGRQVLLNNVPVALSIKDFDLAVFLLRNVGRVLSRAQIVESVWGTGIDITSRTLDTHVSRVRTKLWLTQPNNWHLAAVYGYGYRLERLV